MGNKHAKLAPSGASRWMVCPGSIALCEQVPTPPTSQYAMEGTAAHKLAEIILNSPNDDKQLPGGMTTLPASIEVEDKTFKVDEDMIEAVDIYIDELKRAIKDCKVGNMEMGVEKEFDLSWIHKDMGHGTNDCCILKKKDKKIQIYDYKHGQGVLVQVEWNPQLMIYALGALYETWDADELLPITHSIEEVELIVVQPRIACDEGPVRRWTISTEDLLYWALHVLRPCAKRTEEADAKLVPGDHCRFCDAAAVCSAKIEAACALAKTEFSKPIFPEPADLKPEHLAEILQKAGLFEKWVDQIKAYSFNQLELGVVIPGYKLVQKKSNRAWVDDGGAIAAKLGDEAYTRKIISVTQAEKILKAKGASPEAELKDLWEKPDNGLTMAKDADRRKEVAAPVAMDFLDDADFLD